MLYARSGGAAEGDTSAGDRPWYAELVGEPPPDETHDGITWTYVGQFTFDDPDYTPPLDEREAHDGYALQMAAVRVDSLGREWHVASVDVEAMQRAVDDYATSVREESAAEYTAWRVTDELAAVRDGAVWEGEIVPNSWAEQDCDSSSPDDLFVWDGESRVETDMTATSSVAIQSAVILLEGGSFVCSGSFVDADGKVLTAAHCVTLAASGAPKAASTFQVCTFGLHYNSLGSCYDVDAITPDPSYPGSNHNTSFVNDYAVMSVDLGGDSVSFLPLSTHTTSQLEASTKSMGGFPEWVQTGGGACLWNNPSSGGQLFFRETGGDVVAATAGQLKTRLDTTAGESGAAITHTSGGVQHHAAVDDGFSNGTVPQWSGGARTSANVSFITANP